MVSAISDKQIELASLCEQFGVQRLEVFGSAASEAQFDPARSDVDLIVEFRPEQSMGSWLEHYFQFRDALSNLFDRPVDLVMASAIKNRYFIREANRTRRLLYAS